MNNNNEQPIYLAYSKSKAWLKNVGLFNLLYTYITKLVTNYTLIGEYKARFFLNNTFTCLYGNSLIEIRTHIIYEYYELKTLEWVKRKYLTFR